MVAKLIIILVVMVVINALMLYVLKSAATTTYKEVRACFVRELEAYDTFLDDREEKRKKLEHEAQELDTHIEEMQGVMASLQTSPFYAPRPIPRDLFVPIARYIDDDFFDDHKIVSERMKDLDEEEVMGRIRQRYPYEGNKAVYEAATNLLDSLHMETVYGLVSMPGSSQLAILDESIEEGSPEYELLVQYLEESGYADEIDRDSFDTLSFINWLRDLKTANDPLFYVYTGRTDVADGSVEGDTVTRYDGNISEGVKFVHQNKLFDFSIYRSRNKKAAGK